MTGNVGHVFLFVEGFALRCSLFLSHTRRYNRVIRRKYSSSLQIKSRFISLIWNISWNTLRHRTKQVSSMRSSSMPASAPAYVISCQMPLRRRLQPFTLRSFRLVYCDVICSHYGNINLRRSVIVGKFNSLQIIYSPSRILILAMPMVDTTTFLSSCY